MANVRENWEAWVESEVVWGERHPEDGERREEIVYFVVLENEPGDRFGSLFTSLERGDVENLLVRVSKALSQGASPRDSSKWAPRSPRYCSPAWGAYGEAEQVALERKQADEEPFSRFT